MKNRNFKLYAVSACSLFATYVLAFCGITPIFVIQNGPPSLVPAGGTVQYQVGISQAAPSGGQVLTINPDDYDNFSSIPSSITVPAGHTTATFQATLSPVAYGTVTLEAGCNGTFTDCPVFVVEEDQHMPPPSVEK